MNPHEIVVPILAPILMRRVLLLKGKKCYIEVRLRIMQNKEVDSEYASRLMQYSMAEVLGNE